MLILRRKVGKPSKCGDTTAVLPLPPRMWSGVDLVVGGGLRLFVGGVAISKRAPQKTSRVRKIGNSIHKIAIFGHNRQFSGKIFYEHSVFSAIFFFFFLVGSDFRRVEGVGRGRPLSQPNS